MAHPILLVMVGAISFKVFLALKTFRKKGVDELRKEIAEELKSYNFPDEKAEKIADSVSRKVLAGDMSLRSIAKAFEDSFEEFKGEIKDLFSVLSAKVGAAKDETVAFFRDWFDGKTFEDASVKPLNQTRESEGSTEEKKPMRKAERGDEIIGQSVRVKACGAISHLGDQPRCLCRFVGQMVEIEAKSLMTENDKPLYKVRDYENFVLRSEVVLPKKK